MKYDELLCKRVRDVPPSGIRKFFDVVADMPAAISLGVGEPDFTTLGIQTQPFTPCAGATPTTPAIGACVPAPGHRELPGEPLRRVLTHR